MLAEFAREIDELVHRLRESVGPDDLTHLRRAEAWGIVSALLGYATACVIPTPVSPVLLTIGQMTRWGIAHHVLHRGYDQVPDLPRRFHSRHFARGWRRLLDWCDWIIPEAWQFEHNVHHLNTGGEGDPDVVEANVEFIRQAPRPLWRKCILALTVMFTWRMTYYVPSTFIQLRLHEQGLPPVKYVIKDVLMFRHLFNPFSKEGSLFWRRCLMPYAGTRLLLIPLLFMPLGIHRVINVFLASLTAEAMINFYSWAIIASTHTGADIHRFGTPPRGRGEFYLHQVLGTANYTSRGEASDFLQIWVNFQVEHHLCPNLPIRKYREFAREIAGVCSRHGVPYIVEPLPRRFMRMFAVVVGGASMKRYVLPRQPSTEGRQMG